MLFSLFLGARSNFFPRFLEQIAGLKSSARGRRPEDKEKLQHSLNEHKQISFNRLHGLHHCIKTI